MKKILITITTMLGLLVTAGCEDMMGDFLEKAPSVDVTEDVIFSSKTEAEKFLASIYRYGIHSNLGYGDGVIANPASTLSAGATDEAETCAAWYEPNNWNTASVNADKTDDRRFSYRWIAIRKIALLLKRIDDVPDIDKEYADQLKAEVKVIRALNYFEMFKYYGGVPIIDRYIQLDENFKIPRSTVQQVVDFIVRDCDEALPDLPENQTGSLRGRVHQGVALAIKSKTLLYAASPQFNTAAPYLDLGANNPMICYGNEDPARWEKAAEAAKAALDWAPAAGCELITEEGVDKNYQYSWEKYDNKEIILAEKGSGSIGKWTWPWSAIAPPDLYAGNSGQSGISPTFNFVMKYEKRDGTPQTWDMQGGDDLQAKLAELDRRFAQTIASNMSYWNWEFPQLELFQGGRHANTCYGGFWLHKLYPSEISETIWTYVPNSTIFQLNEIYLNYAEAMNEAYGPDDAHGYDMTARDAINIIRARSGQPAVKELKDKNSFREKIRNERAIELAFDNHRFWDIRRWLIAEKEGVMTGSMYGIKIYKRDDGSNEFRYEPYVFETRSWSRKLYLHPFGTNEINKGYLIQNPGY